MRLSADTDVEKLERLDAEIQQRLWDEFGGEIQFALGWGTTPTDARAQLEIRKRQAGREVLQKCGAWHVEHLTRLPLDEPCDVCHEFPWYKTVTDPDEDRKVRHCRSCFRARSIGAELTRKQWLLGRLRA